MFRLLVPRRPLQYTSPTVSRLFSTSQGAGASDSSSGWEPKTESELRSALVKAAFIHAKDLGFNDQAIVEACKDFGYPSVSCSIVKRGPIEVVDYAMEFWLTQMKEEMERA